VDSVQFLDSVHSVTVSSRGLIAISMIDLVAKKTGSVVLGEGEHHFNRVLLVVRVVARPDARGDETECRIELEGSLVRTPHFEQHRTRATRTGEIDDMREQGPRQASAAELGQRRNREHVQLVAHQPREEKRPRAVVVLRSRQKNVRPRVLQLVLEMDGRLAEAGPIDGHHDFGIEATCARNVDHGACSGRAPSHEAGLEKLVENFAGIERPDDDAGDDFAHGALAVDGVEDELLLARELVRTERVDRDLIA